MNSENLKSDWLLETEAAEYCRCSLWAFRKMDLPAHDSGGRKVYRRGELNAAIEARPWNRSPATPNGTLPVNLRSARLRPYKARLATPVAPPAELRAATAEELAPLWGYSINYWLRAIACKPTFPKRLGRRPATWVLSEVLAWRDSCRDPA